MSKLKQKEKGTDNTEKNICLLIMRQKEKD